MKSELAYYNPRKSKLRKALKISLIVLVLLLLISCIALYVTSYIIIKDMSSHRVEKLEAIPSNLGLPEKTIELTSSDGIPLKAWLIEKETSKGIVILLHGMDGIDASGMLGQAKFLYDAGYSSVALDMRAHGRSGGDRIGFAYSETKDVFAVLDYIEAQDQYKDKPVIILGLSMGGATALRTAGLREDVDAVISLSSFAAFDKVSGDFMRSSNAPEILIGLFKPFFKLAASFIYDINAFIASPEYDIKKIAPRPIMLVHSKTDDQIPVKHAYDLFAACEEKAALVILDNTHHMILKGDGTGPEDEQYRKMVIDFLDKIAYIITNNN